MATEPDPYEPIRFMSRRIAPVSNALMLDVRA